MFKIETHKTARIYEFLEKSGVFKPYTLAAAAAAAAQAAQAQAAALASGSGTGVGGASASAPSSQVGTSVNGTTVVGTSTLMRCAKTLQLTSCAQQLSGYLVLFSALPYLSHKMWSCRHQARRELTGKLSPGSCASNRPIPLTAYMLIRRSCVRLY